MLTFFCENIKIDDAASAQMCEFVQSKINNFETYDLALLSFFALCFLGLTVTYFKDVVPIEDNPKLRVISKYYSAVMPFLIISSGGCAIYSVFAYLGEFYSGFIGRFISNDPAVWGQAGDFFGGMLNPFLAFCSFMALLYTINIQSKQLTISTEELKETRKELTASREAQERSSAALDGQLQNLKIQQFEATFFKLLENIRYSNARVEVNIDSLKNSVLNPTTPGSRDVSGQRMKSVPTQFSGESRWEDARVALQNKESSGFYLMANTVRSGLSFIKHAEADLSLNSQFYVEQILNCLTSDMLRLIIVWCSNYAEGEFKALVEQYHFFASLQIHEGAVLGNGLPISELHIDMRAFKSPLSTEKSS